MKTIVSASLAGATLLGVAGSVGGRHRCADRTDVHGHVRSRVQRQRHGLVGVQGHSRHREEYLRVHIDDHRQGDPRQARRTEPDRPAQHLHGRGREGSTSEYWFKDGTRKADGDKHIQFDWDRHIAIVSDKDGRREVVARRHLARRRQSLRRAHAGPIVNGEPASIGSPTTSKRDLRLRRQRRGANRYRARQARHALLHPPSRGLVEDTYLWVAPQLEYLPARIETRKNDEVQTALTLMSVEGIEKR